MHTSIYLYGCVHVYVRMCKEGNEEYHINSLFTSGKLWKGQGDKLYYSESALYEIQVESPSLRIPNPLSMPTHTTLACMLTGIHTTHTYQGQSSSK